MKLRSYLIFAGACASMLVIGSTASAAVTVRVTVENIAPQNGVALTPVWLGFHNGNFDLYNSGAAAGRATAGIERIAEDGDAGQINSDFGAGLTYVDSLGANNAVAATGSSSGRVQGTLGSPIGPPPILPGNSVSGFFQLENDGSNQYLSYASMVIASNDFFVANGNPTGIDLSSILSSPGNSISFFIGAPGTVNDAGTENSNGTVGTGGGFNTSAGNPLFGLPGGQTGPNQGDEDAMAFIRTVSGDPFADFGTSVDPNFNFNNYSSGIGRITLTSIPEPSSMLALGCGMIGAILYRRRKSQVPA